MSATRSGCAGLLEAGLLGASFVPPKPIRQLRNLTRYRKTQIQERQREVNRLHKALEDTGIKLDCVATDILGKSGRDMLDALVAGHDRPGGAGGPGAQADAPKIPRSGRRSEGQFDAHHRLWIGRSCATSTSSTSRSTGSSEAIEQQIGPFGRRLSCADDDRIQQRGAEA